MIATYQIQMALKEIKPKIWRILLIPSNLLLSDLHKVIQTSMGWDNLHLHQFIKNKTFYTAKDPNDDWGADSVDYKKIKSAKKMALVFGGEVLGISPAHQKICDIIAEIPVRGKKESLNVSVAAGIALFRILEI